MSLRRSFFLMTDDRKPVTECACQPVAFIISSSEAPFGLSRRARSVSVFEVWRCWEAFADFRETFAGLCCTFFLGLTDAEGLADFFDARGPAETASPPMSATCSLPAGFMLSGR